MRTTTTTTTKRRGSTAHAQIAVKAARITGPGRFRQIAGCLSAADAAQMREVIEESCEVVDRDSWRDRP